MKNQNPEEKSRFLSVLTPAAAAASPLTGDEAVARFRRNYGTGAAVPLPAPAPAALSLQERIAACRDPMDRARMRAALLEMN